MSRLVRGWSWATVCAAVALLALPIAGVAQEPKSLKQLLDDVRQGSAAERAENKKREEEFRAAKAEQKQLLLAALAKKAAEEARLKDLEAAFEEKEELLPELHCILTVVAQNRRLTMRRRLQKGSQT